MTYCNNGQILGKLAVKFSALAGTKKGLGSDVTSYPPMGKVFCSDYVALVIGIP